MSESFELVVGTYQQYLLGYKVDYTSNECRVEKSFAIHSHLASIRGIAGNRHYLASAGADDSIYLYDMVNRTESGRLMHHSDTVNCVAFTPEGSHLLTCSNDGTIGAVRCGNWLLEKHWRLSHKGLAVNALAIHPSGKIALSAGADGVLRTWNLIKGRQAYATNLVPRWKASAKNMNVLKWSPSGEKYLLAANCKIDLYSVKTAGVISEIKLESKVICAEFLDDISIAVGLESGYVILYDVIRFTQVLSKIAHDNRVKCIAHRHGLIVTASSLGEIKVWRHTRDTLTNLQTINCDARITCLAIIECNSTTRVKSMHCGSEVKGELKRKQARDLKLRQEVTIEYDDTWTVSTDTSVSHKKTKKRLRTTETNKTCQIHQVQNRTKKSTKTNEIDSRGVKRRKLQSNELSIEEGSARRGGGVVCSEEKTWEISDTEEMSEKDAANDIKSESLFTGKVTNCRKKRSKHTVPAKERKSGTKGG